MALNDAVIEDLVKRVSAIEGKLLELKSDNEAMMRVDRLTAASLVSINAIGSILMKKGITTEDELKKTFSEEEKKAFAPPQATPKPEAEEDNPEPKDEDNSKESES
jgi:hypothetical protein